MKNLEFFFEANEAVSPTIMEVKNEEWMFDKEFNFEFIQLHIKGSIHDDTLHILVKGKVLGIEIAEVDRKIGKNNKFDLPLPPGSDLLVKIYFEFGADGVFISGYAGPDLFDWRKRFRTKRF